LLSVERVADKTHVAGKKNPTGWVSRSVGLCFSLGLLLSGGRARRSGKNRTLHPKAKSRKGVMKKGQDMDSDMEKSRNRITMVLAQYGVSLASKSFKRDDYQTAPKGKKP